MQERISSRLLHVLLNGGELSPATANCKSPLRVDSLDVNTLLTDAFANIGSRPVSGVRDRRVISDVTIADSVLSECNLTFCAWADCVFKNTTFSLCDLTQTKFSGCTFENVVFHRSELRSASFAQDLNGTHTRIRNTSLDRCNLSGADIRGVIFVSSRITDCKANSLSFEDCGFDRLAVKGEYGEFGFCGEIKMPREPFAPSMDLSEAHVSWLTARHGVDLTRFDVSGPQHRIVIRNRERAVERICTMLSESDDLAPRRVARMLAGIYSARSIQPMSSKQTSFYLSLEMVKEFGRPIPDDKASEVLERIEKTMG